MKRRVPGLIKRIMAALSSKTNEFRTRIMIFFLLHSNRSLLLEKFHTVVAGRHAHRNPAAAESLHFGNDKDDEGESFVMMYMNTEPLPATHVVDPTSCYNRQENPEDWCTDLTHTLFKESEADMELMTENEDACEDGRGITSMVTVLEGVDDGRLDEDAGEEDIDHAADLFIERFRRQIRLQKQLSLQERRSTTEMLQQNV